MDIIKSKLQGVKSMTPRIGQTTKLLNGVREYCEAHGMDRNDFVAKCISSRVSVDGKRLTVDTASRVYDGETGISLKTASLVAVALGVDISEIFKTQ